MAYVSIGDMAQSFRFRQHNQQLKTTLAQLTDEVASGVQQDIGAALKGEFTSYSGLVASIARLDAYAQSASVTGTFLSVMQATLGTIQDQTAEFGATLISVRQEGDTAALDAAAQDGAQRFSAVVTALNTQAGGRYVFSGMDTATRPLTGPDEILTALSTAVSGLSTAEEILTAVNDWFAAPAGAGGYGDLAYQGSDSPLAAQRVSDAVSVSAGVTANDERLRDMLQGLALSALVAKGMVPSDPALRSQLLDASGRQVMSASSALTSARTEVGVAEAAVSAARTRNSAERTSLETARLGMVAADPYDTSTALKAVQTQLETLYALTSRLSGMHLTDYL